MDIWALCEGASHLTTISDDFVRIVESQQQIATTQIVGTLEEQRILEGLLEHTKPPLPTDHEHLHYLLATPFLYPPLEHGSRFGQRHERSLFYASKSVSTLLAEAGYYRFIFWHGMTQAPPSDQFITEHTVFSGRYYSEQAVQLQAKPFNQYQQQLTDPQHYRISQQLGSAMREAGIQAIEYVSARDKQHGINVALFTPDALLVNEPLDADLWICSTSAEVVSFTNRQVNNVFRFEFDDFACDGVLPAPAF